MSRRATDPEEDLMRHNRAELIATGYSASMANALAENGHGVCDAFHLNAHECLNLWLEWEGIIGFTHSILTELRAIEIKKGPALP